jgi:hypothetical protein
MKHYLGICLVLITLTGVVWFGLHSCTASVDHTIDSVRDAFVSVLRVQPQVTINQRVVLTQTAPIAELAVVTKEELISLGEDAHTEVLSVQVPLTEKTLTAEAVFRIKAGFDLRQPFSVEIDPATHDVHATMPHATILSVEQIGNLSLKGDDAWLNRITDAERADLVNKLNVAAHDAAEKSDLKEDAEKQVTQRLNELINRNGKTMQLKWSEAVPTKG